MLVSDPRLPGMTTFPGWNTGIRWLLHKRKVLLSDAEASRIMV